MRVENRIKMPGSRNRTARLLNGTIGLLTVCLLLLLPTAGWTRDSGDQWRRLSPKDKENIQRNYQRWQTLPPQDKQHLREEWNRYQSLPPDQREQLRRRYDEQRQQRPYNNR
ncbi:MAG TPA: DUF3106 domain-containing protein [Candidatus Binatia bacterium]